MKNKNPESKISHKEKREILKKVYLQQVNAQTLDFKIPTNQLKTVITRLNYFADTFGSLNTYTYNGCNIIISSPHNTTGIDKAQYEYYYFKTIYGNYVEISVRCTAYNAMEKNLDRNLKIYAYYAKTGKLPFHEVIDGRPVRRKMSHN